MLKFETRIVYQGSKAIIGFATLRHGVIMNSRLTNNWLANQYEVLRKMGMFK